MNFALTILDTTDKGVRVALDNPEAAFWLPRKHPAVVWSREPAPGETVSVCLPSWLVAKHGPLRQLRHQMSISFHQPPGLGPEASREGSFPMAETNDGRGALFRIPDDEKKNDKWPDYRGDITIEGTKWKLAGWVKTDKNGGKYLSLVAKPFEERQPERQQHADRGGPSFSGDAIPFAPVL